MKKLQLPGPVSVLLLVAVLVNAITAQASQLVPDFYVFNHCPDAENLITTAVLNKFNNNQESMPGILRMHFHDCFVAVRRTTGPSYSSRTLT